MEDLKALKKRLICIIEEQLNSGIETIDAKELGEVIDMVKDIAETMYYCSIAKAMEESETEEIEYHMNKYVPGVSFGRYGNSYYRDMDKDLGRMYYTEPWHDPISAMGKSQHNDMGDYKKSKSYVYRKEYMDMKKNGKSPKDRLDGLEKYILELSDDIEEMLDDSTSEEQNMVKQRLASFVNKM